MGNLPLIHEGRTVVSSLADQISGHPERAHERWDKYYNESILVNSFAARNNVGGLSKEYLDYGRPSGKIVPEVGGYLDFNFRRFRLSNSPHKNDSKLHCSAALAIFHIEFL